jgi:hypothetical protein
MLPRAALPGGVAVIHMADPTPAEAFRLILRARYPDDPALPDEITSYGWFHRQHNRAEREPEADKAVTQAADAAIKELCKNVRDCSLRLRGILRKDAPPDLIDAAEQQIGDLDVFDALLDCDRGARIYSNVHCIKADVDRITGEPQAVPARSGFPGRPSSSQLVDGELDRRIAALTAGKFLGPDIKTVTTSLSTWLKVTHPDEPQATAKSIGNRLGRQIRQHVPMPARK